jgi:hypothetical protein
MSGPDEEKTHSEATEKLHQASRKVVNVNRFIEKDDLETSITEGGQDALKVFRYVLIVVLILASIGKLLYAEIAVGWTDALYVKVENDTVLASCSPLEANDRKPVYVTCPVIYTHNFKTALSGSFVENIKPGLELNGLSIELVTEIYQWKEIETCSNDGAQESPVCGYTFQKEWVSEPNPHSRFTCQHDGQQGCGYPAGGVNAVRNEGLIPASMKSFRKVADPETVSIGDNPSRFYLSEDLIQQLPAQTTPFLFTKDGLPSEEGYVTSISGDTSHPELRLQKNPNSAEPSIGDLRASLMMTDFVSRDENRFVSVVAEQYFHIHGERHRTLVPWNSNLKSFKYNSPLKVNWLDVGVTSFNDMVSEFQDDAWDGIKVVVIHLRVWGFVSMAFAVLLLSAPMARTWLTMRTWEHTWHITGIRDISFLVLFMLTISSGFAAMIVALPWFHYMPLRGGAFLLGGFVLLLVVLPLMLRCSSTSGDTFYLVLLEHGIVLPGSLSSMLRRALPASKVPLVEDSRLGQGTVDGDIESAKGYGAVGRDGGADSSTTRKTEPASQVRTGNYRSQRQAKSETVSSQ